MSVNPKGSSSAPLPLLKNAAGAPMVYFDNVPVCGAFCGHIEVELSARMLLPKADGSVTVDMACTGHLRCSPQAAAALRDSLNKALDLLTQQTEETSPLLKN